MSDFSDLLRYDLGPGAEAFSTRRESRLPYSVVQAHQVHGVRIAEITSPSTTREELDGFDALITNVPGCAIAARTADCIPVLIYDPVVKAAAAVHSGWRGTVERISDKVVSEMSMRYGSNPSDLRCVIGPGISKASFQVGKEVVDRFDAAGFDMDSISSYEGEPVNDGSMRGGYHVDLWEACRLTLIEAGVINENIQTAGICTYLDASFFSARREGISCGRILNSIVIL